MPDAPKQNIGLIAGWGRFPVLVAEALKQQGHSVYCLGVKAHADPELSKICDHFQITGVGRTSSQIRYFRRHGCGDAILAGKIFKTLLFRRFGVIRHLPDLGFLRCFAPVLITKKKDRRDDTLLTLVTDFFARYGVRFMPATDFAPELLVKNGTLTKGAATPNEMRDIQFGWQMAREMGRLDIGQSVVVKNQAVMAVEAIEGTDECIRRAGELSSGGFTVVKVAKPNQDMRFDVPTVGVGTIETIKNAGGKVLAIEAQKTIMLDQQETIDAANRLGIKIVALSDAEAKQAAA